MLQMPCLGWGAFLENDERYPRGYGRQILCTKIEKVCLANGEDRGVGMDPKTMERILDTFFRSKETGMGTGLGLASVYGIVKAHGVYIDVDSEKGQGSIFSIFVAAYAGRPEAAVKVAEQIIEGRGVPSCLSTMGRWSWISVPRCSGDWAITSSKPRGQRSM